MILWVLVQNKDIETLHGKHYLLLTLLHSEWPKLSRVLAVLTAVELKKYGRGRYYSEPILEENYFLMKNINCGSSLELNHNSDSVRFENTCLYLEIGKVSKFSLQKLWLIFTFGTVCICKHLNHSICSMLLTRNDC